MSVSHRRAALFLLAAALLFSTGGAAIKAAQFTGWQIASFRSGIAGVVLVLLVPAARQGWGWRPFAVGIAYAATCICFVLATRMTTSANAIFLQATSPIYVVLLGPVLLREPIQRRDLLFLGAVAIGLTLFLLGGRQAEATAPRPSLGNLISLVSGFTFALLMMGLRWLGKAADGNRATPATAAAIGNFTACLATLPLALPLGEHPISDWGVLLYLGIFQIGLAYALVTRAMARLSALEATVLLLLEPALNPVWTWLVHGEVPGFAAILGGLVILGATLARALSLR